MPIPLTAAARFFWHRHRVTGNMRFARSIFTSTIIGRIRKLPGLLGAPDLAAHERRLHWIERTARLRALESRSPDPLALRRGSNASTAIDVVFPVGPRDVAIFALALEGILENLQGSVRHVSCVAPTRLCRVLERRHADLTVIPEDEILPSRLKTKLEVTFGERAGWFTQQFVTLSTPELTSAYATVVIDADTIILRPRQFRINDTTLLLAAPEFHIPYFEALARLWREPVHLPPYSFIAHHMCFLRHDVLAMRRAIEQLWGRHWTDAILASCDPREPSGFSEYELYGQWRLKTAPESTVVRTVRNVSLPRWLDASLPTLRRMVPSGAYSVSCHWHSSPPR